MTSSPRFSSSPRNPRARTVTRAIVLPAALLSRLCQLGAACLLAGAVACSTPNATVAPDGAVGSDAGLSFGDARVVGSDLSTARDTMPPEPGDGVTPCSLSAPCPSLRPNCCAQRCFAAACIDTLSSGRGGAPDAPLAQASFSGVQGMVADGQGNLFFTEAVSAGIRVVNRGSTAIGRVAPGTVGRFGSARIGCRPGPIDEAEMRLPIGLARDADGNLYAGDVDCRVIWKIRAEDRRVSILVGQPGDAAIRDGAADVARPGRPRGLVYHARKLYFTDMDANLLRAVSLDGTPQLKTLAGKNGTAGATDGAAAVSLLDGPAGVAVASDGTVFVAEYSGKRIRSVSHAGEPNATVATALTLTSAQGSPGHVMLSAGSDGKLYSAFWSKGVYRLPTTAPFAATRLTTAGVISVLADPSGGFLWFGGWHYAAPATGLLANTLGRYDLSGAPLELLGTPGQIGVADGRSGEASFAFASCNASLAVGGDGSVWVADRCAHRVRRIARDGSVSSFGSGLAAETAGSASTAAFCGPVALTVVGENVYVANSACGYKLSKIDAAGNVSLIGSVCVPDEPGCPRPSLAGGMVADAEGALYVSTYLESGAGASTKYGKSGWDGMPMLVKIPALGTGTPSFFAGSPNNPHINGAEPVGSNARHGQCVDGAPGTGQFGLYPYGLALAADGTILVADAGCGVRRVAQDGTITTLQRNVAGTGVAVGPGPHGAQTVLATKGDALWALHPATGAGVDYVGSNNWTYENHAQDGALPAATLWGPSSLAVDARGQLIILDRLNNRIRVLRPRAR
jgi:DNA-binding beta-propeller fold protein YncE